MHALMHGEMMSKNNRQNRERKKQQALAKQKARRKSTLSTRSGTQQKPNLTLPAAITGEVAAFCEDIAPTSIPQYVEVKGAPGAKRSECFVNVDAYVASHGGSVSYGWNVMEWPGVLLEGEFHAVWRGSDGEMLDVTPRIDGEKRILFLPDLALVYDGRYTPSKQRALTGAPPETAEFIDACQAMWAFQASRFVDDGIDGALSVSPGEVMTLQKLQAAANDAHRRLVAAYRERKLAVASAQSADDDAPGGVSPTEINRIARKIGHGPLGLAHHRPQPWAASHSCYNNAAGMVEREGGRRLCGWTFHIRTRPGVGNYVFATPHAVWHNPRDGSLVDVTPHRDPKHAPVMQDGSILFLVDGAADPVMVTDDVVVSPPLRFFAVGDAPAIVDYVASLNERAVADFERDKREALVNDGRA